MLLPFQAARRLRLQCCSILEVVTLLDILTFELLDIQSFRGARYTNFAGRSIFKFRWLLDTSPFTVFSVHKVFGQRGTFTFRATRYSSLSGCSKLKVFGLLDIQSFRSARYFNFSGRSIFKAFGVLDTESLRAALFL